MTIQQIQENLKALIAERAKSTKSKKPAAKPVGKVNGATTLNDSEQLAFIASRIVRAFNLESQGVTVDSLVAGVKDFEKPYEGAVQ